MTPGAMGMAGELAGAVLRAGGREILFSGVLFLIVLVLTGLLRSFSPVLRHALWGLVLLRLVLPLGLSTPFSLGAVAGRAQLASALESRWLAGIPASAGDGPTSVGAEDPASAAVERARETAGWKLTALAVWMLGTLVVAGALARRRRAFRDVVGKARSVTDAAVLTLLYRWKDELGVRRDVRVVTSDELRVPFTYGTLSPSIFLPRAVLESREEGLVESVLAHELAHVRRWDDPILKLKLAVASLYFFNPIAWLSLRKMQEASEQACDELVLSSGGLSARIYGRSILTVAKLALVRDASLTPALFGRRRTLRTRLETIMAKKSPRVARARRVYPIPVATAIGLLLLPMAGGSSAIVPPNGEGASRIAGLEEAQAVTLSNPMPGARISAAWGPMLKPSTRENADHRGIDLVGPPGSEIHAAAPGRVEEATTHYSGGAAYGTVVILDHGDGIKTLYAHLDRLDVEKGQRVSRGDVLGTQGATGQVKGGGRQIRTKGAHLHFEVWENGEFRDPALFVAEWQQEGGSRRL